ncbi:MAG TPA: hypothetical protein VMH86_00450 [Rhizomicrobium sp.]|nr:hypothetical protein [Rhizomicrobium sp.]
MTLTSSKIEQFVKEGFVRIDEAFPGSVADAGREILWRESGCDPNDCTTRTRPVIPAPRTAQFNSSSLSEPSARQSSRSLTKAMEPGPLRTAAALGLPSVL